MTNEATKLLKWIVDHAPTTLPKLLSHDTPTYRRRNRWLLVELIKAGAVYRDQYGWIRPTVLVDKTDSVND